MYIIKTNIHQQHNQMYHKKDRIYLNNATKYVFNKNYLYTQIAQLNLGNKDQIYFGNTQVNIQLRLNVRSQLT